MDPYRDWLGIQSSERPVNYYDLLDLPRGESDAARINERALQRSSIVRKYQLGVHSDLSQKLLNEISAARVCLLDPEKRKAYDAAQDHGAALDDLSEELPVAAVVQQNAPKVVQPVLQQAAPLGPAVPLFTQPLPAAPKTWQAEQEPPLLSGPVLLAVIAIPVVVLLGLGAVIAGSFFGSKLPITDMRPLPPPDPAKPVVPNPPIRPPVVPPVVPLPPSTGTGTLPASARIRNPANGHVYQRIDKAMSWHEASNYCESLGGHLATATTAEENQFIFEKFGQDHVVWLGATDETQEGKWMWVTGEPFQFANWMPGEPSNHGRKEHYANMGNCPGVTFQGRPYFFRFGPKWNDHEESGDYWHTLICYPVCEWEKPDGSATDMPPMSGPVTP